MEIWSVVFNDWPMINMQPQKRLIRNHIIFSCLFSFLFTIFIALFYSIQVLERADLFLYDLHFKWRGYQPTSGNIVLVLMDQRSTSILKRKKEAWSRSQMANALKNLCAAGVEIIALDMVFCAPAHDREEDNALAEAIKDCDNVILANVLGVEGGQEMNPLPIFKEGMIGDGFINMFPDRDGILRKISLFSIKPLKEGVDVSPSFSLEVTRAYLNLDFILDFSREDHILVGPRGMSQLSLPYPDLLINFYGGEDAFRRLSYADVVNNRFSPGAVEGKIVLIGSSLPTKKDFFATPFPMKIRKEEAYKDRFGKVLADDSRLKTTGVACHANAIETILNGSFISKCPGKYVVLLVVLFGLLGLIFYSQRLAALWVLSILVISLGTLIGLSHYAFVKYLYWLEIAPIISVLLLQYIGGIVLQRVYSKKRTRVVTTLFGKFVSRDVVKNLLKGDLGVELEGRSQEVTVLFSDLRGFTTLSEDLNAQETGQLLNVYFDAMIPIVFDNQGTLDKLMGDAVMAFFGAPGEVKEHPQKAAETALKMIERLKELKEERNEKGIDRLQVGIGLNTGMATVGNLGSWSFMDYTVIGDMVNLGSRLEGLNKTYGTSIIISEFTAERLDSRFVLRELDRVKVKGKGDAVTIFELAGHKDRFSQEKLSMIMEFGYGISLYKNKEWEKAEKAFSRLLTLFPGDGPSGFYLERIRELLKNPPASEWEPVTVFKTK